MHLITRADSYCAVSECERPTREGRTYCAGHEKRHQRGQTLSTPLAERLTPKERLLEAAARWVEADAESDEEYERHERAVLRAAKQLSPHASGELIRASMAAARARGVHVGRPPKVDSARARELLGRLGTVTLVALALGVSRAAVRRALARGMEATLSSHPAREADWHERQPNAPAARLSAR